MFIALLNIIKVSTVMAKETTLMALKGSGDILKEGWPPKVELGRNDCPFTWLNMSGVTIIEMITLKTRKNSL